MHVKNKTGRGQFSLEIDWYFIFLYIVIWKKPFYKQKRDWLTLLLHVRSVFFLIFNFSIKKYIMNNNKSFMH